jgi:hypothetical protein
MSTTSATESNINPAAVAHNVGVLSSVHFLSACFSGTAAGILGLTNFYGFLLFFASLLFSALCISILRYSCSFEGVDVACGLCYSRFRCGGSPGKYLLDGWWELVKPSQDTLFGFILLWTLFYGKLSMTLLYL